MKNKKLPYHTALGNDIKNLGELEEFEQEGNIFFIHDASKGNNVKFNECEVIYAEISWSAGYDKFSKRANLDTGTFNDYLNGIQDIIDKQNKPTYITAGKHMLNKFKPQQIYEIKLHGASALLMTWNTPKDIFKGKTNFDVQELVAQKYNHILNFSVGYGTIVHYAQKYNKKVIGSDINKHCLYFIKQEYFN